MKKNIILSLSAAIFFAGDVAAEGALFQSIFLVARARDPKDKRVNSALFDSMNKITLHFKDLYKPAVVFEKRNPDKHISLLNLVVREDDAERVKTSLNERQVTDRLNKLSGKSISFVNLEVFPAQSSNKFFLVATFNVPPFLAELREFLENYVTTRIYKGLDYKLEKKGPDKGDMRIFSDEKGVVCEMRLDFVPHVTFAISTTPIELSEEDKAAFKSLDFNFTAHFKTSMTERKFKLEENRPETPSDIPLAGPSVTASASHYRPRHNESLLARQFCDPAICAPRGV